LYEQVICRPFVLFRFGPTERESNGIVPGPQPSYKMPGTISRDPRYPKSPWRCRLQRADGTETTKSTGSRDAKRAKIICDAWQQAEYEAAGKDLTHDRVSRILNETLERLGHKPLERISIEQWLNQWLAGKTEISAATRFGYEQVVREFLTYLGPRGVKRRLDAIAEADIRGFMALLADEGRSSGTVNKLVRKYLSTAFEKARLTGRIKFNPVRAVDPQKTDVSVRDTFTAQQVIELLRHADSDWRGAILLGYTTGARLQDIANLRWSDLDASAGVISFTQRKTGRRAVVGIHADFLEWVAERAGNDDPSAYLFPTLGGRNGAGRNGLSRAFESIMRRAGVVGRLIRKRSGAKGRSLSGLSFHSFRHGAASMTFNVAAIKEVSRRVTAHAKKGEIDRYVHENLELIREATKLIPRLPRKK
jgi:integrase